MGDIRYERAYTSIVQSADPLAAIAAMDDLNVVAALASTSRHSDPYIANVLATEVQNRVIRQRAVFESLDEGVYVVDEDGEVVDQNESLDRLLGWSAEELVAGEAYANEGDRARVEAIIPEVLENDGVARFALEMRRKDGSTLWTEHSLTLAQSPMGRQLGYVGVIRDVTQAHRRDEELAHKAALIEATFQHTPILFACLDSDFRFSQVNRAYAATLGEDPSWFVGKNHFDLFPNPEVESILKQVRESGESYERFGLPLPTPEGKTQWWDWSARPIYDAKGQLINILLAAIDVTRRDEGEERFERAPG